MSASTQPESMKRFEGLLFEVQEAAENYGARLFANDYKKLRQASIDANDAIRTYVSEIATDAIEKERRIAALTRERDEVLLKNAQLKEFTGFARSCIMSGEQWSPLCEEMYQNARK